jgi:hypothetical protein
MIDYLPLVADQHSRVPKAAKACFRPLVESDVRPDVVLRTRLLQGTDLRPVHVQTFRSETVKERVVVYRS